MNVFLAATDVQLSIDLVDADGNTLDVSAVSYRVTSAEGAELVPLTALTGFVAGSTQVEVDVPAAQNTLDAGELRDLRTVDLACTVDGNTVLVQASYIVQVADPLQVGVNSFQTIAQADFNAQIMPNLAGWAAASREQRMAALIDARLHICQLAFTNINGRGQGYLDWAPEGTRDSFWLGDGFDLAGFTATQFQSLPERFRVALRQAQIAEADAILGGDPIDDKRRAGVVLDSIGESRLMFRPTAPLNLPVCRRALGYLSGFVTFSKRIARG